MAKQLTAEQKARYLEAQRKRRSTPEGRALINEAVRLSRAKKLSTPEGRAQINEASKLRKRKERSTPAGKKRNAEAAKSSKLKRLSTPEGRSQINEASKLYKRKERSTAEGRAKNAEAVSRCVERNKPIYNLKRNSLSRDYRIRRPNWLSPEDEQKIKEYYLKAAELTALTGVKHSVDHIIPRKGKLVSGLHVPNNLQILTQSDNASKNNIYEIE